MDVQQLRSMAMQYKDAFMAKTEEVEKLTAKLKEIPVTEQLGSEAMPSNRISRASQNHWMP